MRSNWAEPITKFLFSHPLIKALMLGVLGIAANVLSGAYVFDITKSVDGVQVLDWSSSNSSKSFWGLAGVLFLMGVYGWGVTRYERGIRNSLNEADVLNLALRELLDPMLDAAKEDIKAGRLRTIEDVKKMFGPGTGGNQS